jgi:hypothetical protein
MFTKAAVATDASEACRKSAPASGRSEHTDLHKGAVEVPMASVKRWRRLTMSLDLDAGMDWLLSRKSREISRLSAFSELRSTCPGLRGGSEAVRILE